jgi:hypothetical protein
MPASMGLCGESHPRKDTMAAGLSEEQPEALSKAVLDVI